MTKNKSSIIKMTLDNGLDFILNDDKSKGYVAVNIWYHVGSKNEKKGKTGFAHLFEHLMFEGSKNCDKNWFSVIEPISIKPGGINGSTNTDRTNYWQNISPNYLERVLFMEADRMGYLTEALNEDKLIKEKKIVIQERKQSYENSPYGDSEEFLQNLLFPKPHPYNWQTIGLEKDINNAKLSETIDFHKQFYIPSNASLTISGNFSSGKAVKWVTKYFNNIPSPKKPNTKFQKQSSLKNTTTHEIIGKSPATLPKLIIRWPTNSHNFSTTEQSMSLLSLILGDGLGSRLQKSLVTTNQLAQDVYVGHYSQELAGEFEISATLANEKNFDIVYKKILEEIKNISENTISNEEILIAKNKYQLSLNRQIEKSGGFGGIADILNYFNIYGKNPADFLTYMNSFKQVNKKNIYESAQYLISSPHINLYYKVKK